MAATGLAGLTAERWTPGSRFQTAYPSSLLYTRMPHIFRPAKRRAFLTFCALAPLSCCDDNDGVNMRTYINKRVVRAP